MCTITLKDSKYIYVDLEEFSVPVQRKLTNICWQTKFEECHQQMLNFLVIVSEKYGRLRTSLSEVCRQTGRTQSLDWKSEAHIYVFYWEDLVDLYDHNCLHAYGHEHQTKVG